MGWFREIGAGPVFFQEQPFSTVVEALKFIRRIMPRVVNGGALEINPPQSKEVYMAQARGSQNGGHYYSNIVTPQEINLSWTVSRTDSGGLGLTGLKSNGWARYAFMNTSATPGVVNGVTNPNPAAGLVVVQMKQNFNVFLQLGYTPEATVTGAAFTTLTAGKAYQIVTLGTTTTAQWVTAGLIAGFAPAVGQVFLSGPGGALGGSGTVKLIGTSNIYNVEVIGNPTLTAANSSADTNGGAFFMLQFLNAGALAAPTDGSVINVNLLYDRSSVTVDGL